MKEALTEVKCRDIGNVEESGCEYWGQYEECQEDERMGTPGGEDRTGYRRRKTRSRW